MKQYINILFSLCLCLTLFTSCESLLEVEPEEVLLSDDYLGDDNLDARSALFGVLGQMQEVAGQYVVLGEMRADLVDVVADTEGDLRQISTHNITEDNRFIDPTTLFSIVNNCNFALEGIDTEANQNELLEDYASILRVRTWVQFQILINYGKLPYLTKPIKSNDDLNETYPILTYEEGIDTLIQNLLEISGIENVTKYENSLTFSIYNMIPDQNILLGDLYLWKGEGNYATAATYYKQFLDESVALGIYNLDASNAVVEVAPSGSEYTYTTRWLNIFTTENVRTNEVISYSGYSEEFRQPNDMYSVLTTQMRASSAIIENFEAQWLAYEKAPVQLGDTRANWSFFNFSGIEELALIRKYRPEYMILNRAAKVYLRYAEAINNAGHPRQALTIINGIFNDINTVPNDANIFDNAEEYLNFDKELYYTLNNGGQPVDGNLGIRGRVSMAAVGVDDVLTDAEAIAPVDALILNEAALELAFEGNRWEDLIRFAQRAEDPSILADAVANKFEDAGTAADVRARLLNPENWFLPLTIPDNFVAN